MELLTTKRELMDLQESYDNLSGNAARADRSKKLEEMETLIKNAASRASKEMSFV